MTKHNPSRIARDGMALRAMRAAWHTLPQAARRLLSPAIEYAHALAQHRQLRRSWQRDNPAGSAVSVIGFHGAVLGLGEGARMQAAALGNAGLDVETVDVGGLLDTVTPATLPMPGDGRTVISHLNPPELLRYLTLTNGEAIRDRRHIGYWAWELETPPRRWRAAFDLVDEIWVPSRFVAAALARLPGPRPPIRVIPHPVHLLPPPRPASPRTADNSEALRVLVAMDLRSSLARKNFDGVLAVTQAMDQWRRGAVRFVIKFSGGHAEPALLTGCLDRLRRSQGVEVLHEDHSEQAMSALIGDCDVVLSLHRAEGFGLLLAHGMHAGKLVVATGWSGNCDFMSGEAAVPLAWRSVAVRDASRRYRGSSWAEPDLAQAIATLQRAALDRRWLHAMSAKAPAHLAHALGGGDWIARTRRHLGPSLSSPATSTSLLSNSDMPSPASQAI